MQSISIKFQSPDLIPAPFAHTIELQLSIEEDKTLKYDFHLQYYGREELSEEELADEGFSTDDDLKLTGILPAVWRNYLVDLYGQTNDLGIKEINDTQSYWEIHNGKKGMYPKNHKAWEYFLQEIRQAMVENSKLELPLLIHIKRSHESFEIKASFENRLLSINNVTLLWSELDSILKDLYAGEINCNKASEKEPTKEGFFIEFGDGVWLEIGLAYLIKPSKITKWIQN